METNQARTIKPTHGVLARCIGVAVVRSLTLIDVTAVGAITGVTLTTNTQITTAGVNAAGVLVTVVVIAEALLNVVAVRAVSVKSKCTLAVIRSWSIGTVCVAVAMV